MLFLWGSLNLKAPNFELCYLSLPQFYPKSHYPFYCLSQDSSCILSEHSEWYLWFWIPRNKPNKDSTKVFVYKASDWSWMCSWEGENIYISTGFLSPFSFWKFQPKLYWIFNCDFFIWPLYTCIDRISQTREDDTFWYMQLHVHQEVIAELIALYFINNFH